MISRRNAVLLGVGAAGVVAAGGVAYVWRSSDGDTTSPPPNDRMTWQPVTSDVAPNGVETLVRDDGFDITLGSVRVFGPGGVASTGAKVTLTFVDREFPAELAGSARSVGQSVQIVIGDNEQPKAPITIEFSLGSAVSGEANSDEKPLLVAFGSEDRDEAGLLQGRWDASRSVLSVTTDHLSWYKPWEWDLGKWFSDFLSRLLGLTFTRPSCALQSRKIDETTYSFAEIDDDDVLPCLQQRNDQILVELHSNSVLPWAVKSIPSVTGEISGEWKDVGPVLSGIYSSLYGAMGDERTAVMPGNVATLRFEANDPPSIIDLKIDPGLFLVSTLLYAAQSAAAIFFPQNGMVAELFDGFEGLDCLVEVQNTFYQIEDEGNLTGVVRSTLSCVLAMMSENATKLSLGFIARAGLTVMNLLVGGASLIAAGIMGAYRTATSKDQIRFEVYSDDIRSSSSRIAGTQGPALDRPIIVKWRAENIGPVYGGLIVHDGRIYVASQRGPVSIDAVSGQEDWRAEAYFTASGTPSVADGLALFGSNDRAGGMLQAFDIRSGEERWVLESFAVTTPTIVGQTVFVGADGDTLAIDLATGTEIWRLPGSSNWASTPAVVNGTVYVGNAHGALYAIDAESGRERWHFSASEWIGAPVVGQEMIFVISDQRTLHALDINTAVERWRVTSTDQFFTTPVLCDDLVLIDQEGDLLALDAADGMVRWQFSPGTERVFTDLKVAEDVVYACGTHVYAIAAADGNEYWRYQTEWETFSPSMAVGEGGLYITTRDTALMALGNLPLPVLRTDATLRGTPSKTGTERATANAGSLIDHIGQRDEQSGEVWVMVTIGNESGWVPLDAIDLETLPPDDAVEYVYIPQ